MKLKEFILIPRVIHQIWIGKKLPPQELMNTWKISGFDYVLWDEEALSKLTMVNQDKYDYFYNKKVFHGCADIARVEILKQYGGVYIDADTRCLKPLPDTWFDNYNFFAVQANNESKYWNYRVANGVMASEINGSVIIEYNEQIKNATKIEPCWCTIGGTTLTNILVDNFKNDPSILILEPYTFYPKGMRGYTNPRASKAYAIHYWGSKNKKVYNLKDTS